MCVQAALELLRIDDSAYEALNATFERALTVLHKMPVIWLLYVQHLQAQRLYTRLRHTFDAGALSSLLRGRHLRA